MKTTHTLALLLLAPFASAQKLPVDLGHGPRPVPLGTFERVVEALHYDVEPSGTLVVRGGDYKACFDRRGLEFVPYLGSDAPRNYPLRLTLERATLAGRELLLAHDVEPVREGDVVSYDRGWVVERHHLALGSVEQTFELDGLGDLMRGDLELQLSVEGELVARVDADALVFEGAHGGVRYGGLTVLDGRGRSLVAPSRVVDGRLRLTVPGDFVRSATLPLVVDPLISTFPLDDRTNVQASECDIAYDETNQEYLVVWQETFSGSDVDIGCRAFDGTGNPKGGYQYLESGTERWAYPSVANCNGSNRFLMVCEAGPVGDRWLGRRLRTAGSGTLGEALKTRAVYTTDVHRPSVGGSIVHQQVAFVVAYGSDFYDAVWVWGLDQYGTSASVVWPAGGFPIDDTGANDRPRVSKTSGVGPLTDVRWNLAWQHFPAGGGPSNVQYCQVGRDGESSPIRTITSAQPIGPPCPSPPLDALAGEREWVLATSMRTPAKGYDVFCWLVRGTELVSWSPISMLEGVAWGEDQVAPSIDTDGTNLLLTYSESWHGSQYDYDLYAATLEKQGGQLHLREPHVSLAYTSYDDRPSVVCFPHRASGTARRAMVGWTEKNGTQIFDVEGALAELSHTRAGELYCTPSSHTGGGYGQLRALGSARISDNQLLFDIGNLPKNEWGYLLMSRKAASLPWYGETLCVDWPIVTFHQSMQYSGSSGYAVFQPDLNQLPGGTVVLPGQTWYFQYWSADQGSDSFTNGVSVSFQ